MTIKHYNKLRKNQGEGISLRSSSNGKVMTLPVDNNPPVFGSSSGFLPIDAKSYDTLHRNDEEYWDGSCPIRCKVFRDIFQ